MSLTEFLLDDRVARDRNTLSIDLRESSLVDQFPDRLEVRVSPGDVRLDDTQHVNRRLVQLHKNSIVDLLESEELEHLARLRGDLVHTLKVKVSIKYLDRQFSRKFCSSLAFEIQRNGPTHEYG